MRASPVQVPSAIHAAHSDETRPQRSLPGTDPHHRRDETAQPPRFGCPRIAQQIAYTFGIEIDKDVVRRVLAKHYHPEPGDNTGPSWLTVIGHAKDSLWSVDLFRCESICLQTHWVLVVMDQFTRRIIGFGIKAGDVDGRALCCMFNHAISQQGSLWVANSNFTLKSGRLGKFDLG